MEQPRGHVEEPRAGGSPLDAVLSVTHERFVAERPAGADEDVHMVAAVVDHVIERCTRPGDTVVDPFAGFGTTLERVIALGRRAVGIELLPERVEQVRLRVPDARLVEGDARGLLSVLRDAEAGHPGSSAHAALRGADVRHPESEAHPVSRSGGVPHPESSAQLVLTSPPYMTSQHHDADPLTAYERDGGDYARYLRELGLVAAQCARMLVPGGFAVWNVADILHRGVTTPLISDVGEVLAQHLTPVGVTRIAWDTHPHDLVADALLVFQRPPQPATTRDP